jgi:SAM-dependent methyltransferase
MRECFYDTPFLQYLVTDIENYAISQLGNLKNKKLFVYGCGVNLKRSIEFIDRGAAVYMIDISPGSIELLLNKVNDLGLRDRIFPIVMDCENLDFRGGEFDAVYGRAILHHLNVNRAMQEIYRVLKARGTSVFIEPLGMIPIINVYRKLTPGRRTHSEKPLGGKDIKSIRTFGFSKFNHYAFAFLCNIGIFLHSKLKVRERWSVSYKKLNKVLAITE